MCNVLKNVGLRPLYNTNNVHYNEIYKWKVKGNEKYYKLGEMENDRIFSTLSLSSLSQTD